MTYATGGTVTEQDGYRIHTFTSSGTLTVTQGGDVEALVVAGGGGGGTWRGGGGGGGGVLYSAALSLSAAAHAITVGDGGSGGNSTAGAQGGNSSIGSLLVAIGGGGGGKGENAGNAGGSGGSGGGRGGAAVTGTQGAGTGTSGQGNNGGLSNDDGSGTANRKGGGGGGAGAVGGAASSAVGGTGGAGSEYSISGAPVAYAGGGGGGIDSTGTPGAGGSGGGGAGSAAATATNGTANTGGGGGGAGGGFEATNLGGDGGSGIVIVRYLLPVEISTTRSVYWSIGGPTEISRVLLWGVNRLPAVSSIAVASPRRDPHFYVTLYPHPGKPNDDQRLDHIDINPDLTGLSWSSTSPGGFARFQSGHNNYERPLANPLIPRDLHMQDFARIEVTDGALVLWEGRTEDRDEAPKDRRTLVAAGWGYSAIHDMPYFSDSVTMATSGDVLKTVLANAAQLIRPASGDLYVDPLVEHAPEEFDAWYPSQVLDQIVKEGDDDGNLMDWFVWEHRALWLKPRVAPSTADYYLPFDRRYVTDWKRHNKDRRGVVWVDHTVSGIATRTGPIRAAGFTDEVGFDRGRVLKVGEMTVSAATRIGQTFLKFHSRARYTGVITIGPDDVLIGAGGRPVPAYMARAGQWVQVGDYEPLMIVVQEYNAAARRQKLTLGDRLDGYEVQVAQTIREAELRKLGSNPLGGRI